MKRIPLIALALLMCCAVEATELIENNDFSTGISPWTLDFGEMVEHNSQDGHLTPNGSAQVTGDVDGRSSLELACIEVSNLPPDTDLHGEVSIKSLATGDNLFGGFGVFEYLDTDCSEVHYLGNLNGPVQSGVWSRISRDAPLQPGVKSIKINLFSHPTPDGAAVLFDDVTLTIVQREPYKNRDAEQFMNPDVTANTNGWNLHWGDSLSHNTADGHLTPNGAVQTTGHDGGNQTGISSMCMDVSSRAPLDEYRVAASFKPGSNANQPHGAIFIDFFKDTACAEGYGNHSFGLDGSADSWTRVEETFVPLKETRSIRVVLLSTGTQDAGLNLYDDFSLTLTKAVRQMWLIGVGTIENKRIFITDMSYTRGGAFGFFDPAEITAQEFARLAIGFTGCHAGWAELSQNETSEYGYYDLQRLASNQAGAICDDIGFDNVGDNNAWMAGYWYGGPIHDGDGFVIDVLDDGVTAIITWYGYLPKWGADGYLPN